MHRCGGADHLLDKKVTCLWFLAREVKFSAVFLIEIKDTHTCDVYSKDSRIL